MDRLGSMSVFVAVTSAGSFSAASRQLRMPLPTVSRRVSELESHLKAKLFVRSTRKLALTDAGQAYLVACKRVLEQIAEAERGASGQYNVPQGELFLTAPIVFGRLHVLPVVTEFLRTHPQVDVRMMLADRALNLVDDHLDLAVRIGALPDSSLVGARIGHIRRVVCASPAYLSGHGVPRSPADLSGHVCVTFTGAGETDSWKFSSGPSVRVHARLAVNTAEAAIEGAIAGVGLTRVLSYQVADEVAAGRLVVVLRKFEPEPSPVSLVRVQERRLTAKLRAFLDFAAPKLRERLT